MENIPENSGSPQEWLSESDAQALRAFEELWKLQMQYPARIREIARGLYYLLPEEGRDELQSEASDWFPDDEDSWRQFIIESLMLGKHERPELPDHWPDTPREAFGGDVSDPPPKA